MAVAGLFLHSLLPLPPRSPNPSRSDRVVRLQIFAAFLVPVALVAVWLWSKGFFTAG